MFAFWTPGPGEIIIVACVFMLFFGIKKLPSMASALGKAIPSFKKGIAEGEREVEEVKNAITEIGEAGAAALKKEPEPQK